MHKNIASFNTSFDLNNLIKLKIPFYLTRVPAGFPSPADDFIEKKLDLNEHLIKKPAATYFVQVEGESMKNAGILSGDILVVDRSLNAGHNTIIVAMLDGEFIVKRLLIRGKKYTLYSDNPDYHDIDISIDHNFEVWGVVTYAIHKTI